jgi:hypothetical protein
VTVSRHTVFENRIFENGTAPLWKTAQQIGPLRDQKLKKTNY